MNLVEPGRPQERVFLRPLEPADVQTYVSWGRGLVGIVARLGVVSYYRRFAVRRA